MESFRQLLTERGSVLVAQLEVDVDRRYFRSSLRHLYQMIFVVLNMQLKEYRGKLRVEHRETIKHRYLSPNVNLVRSRSKVGKVMTKGDRITIKTCTRGKDQTCFDFNEVRHRKIGLHVTQATHTRQYQEYSLITYRD